MTERYNGLPNDPDEVSESFDPYAAGNAADLYRDGSAKQKPWTRDEVLAVRVAMLNLGLTREQVEAQVASICGAEWIERPYLSRRQAG